jgi:hypothetical protein
LRVLAYYYGANVPSSLLAAGYSRWVNCFATFLSGDPAPEWLRSILVDGILQDACMGVFCYASANGNIFPVVLRFWKIWVISPNCI